LNPGLLALKASTLPLGYRGGHTHHSLKSLLDGPISLKLPFNDIEINMSYPR